MQKVIIYIGLLVFFLALIFFSRLGWPFEIVLFKSFILFLVITIMISLLAIIFIKSVNKTNFDDSQDFQ